MRGGEASSKNEPPKMRFWQVDAFTKEPFKGNPAAVFVLQEPLTDAVMQNIALEKNLSETAFVLERKGQNPLLRWFMPIGEIDLCGHATLASAHIYLTEIHPNLNEVAFDTKVAGPLRVTRQDSTYTMDFPARHGEAVDVKSVPAFVLDALTKARPVEARQARDLMLVYEDENTIRTLQPDLNALTKFDKFIIVTAKSAAPYDFISRFFCAADGVPEDPVTGSAHCTSAPYWAKKLGKNKLKAFQTSQRGGELLLEVTPDRVYITGHAVTVFEGKTRYIG
jgi:PhzF family phenazine biosynthesis protein